MVAQRVEKLSVEEDLTFDRAGPDRHMFANAQTYEKVEFLPGDDVSLGT
jgi:hypothetical protein